MRNLSLLASLLAFSGLVGSAHAGSFEGEARDAWLTGKIETVYVLNRHLNAFAIDTNVDGGVAHLTGTVKSDIERDLAGELAKGVDGVIDVRNEIVVDPAGAAGGVANAGEPKRRNFGSWVDDATTTAAVKSRLITNGSAKGLQIDVDTRDDIVTLSGRVGTDAEKDLAESIALNTGDVAEVRNNLVVDAE